MNELENTIRFYNFISGVLLNQEKDPVCCRCKAFENTARRMKEGIAGLESLAAKPGFSVEMLDSLKQTQESMESIRLREGSVGQKKAGLCRMPEGLCFVKLSKAILSRIQEQLS
jgi:hypothetical protein